MIWNQKKNGGIYNDKSRINYTDSRKERTFQKRILKKALAAVISSITEALTNGDKVQLVGFGTFEIRDRKEKESKNPRTGEKIIVPAKKAPAFKAGKALKDAVNA